MTATATRHANAPATAQPITGLVDAAVAKWRSWAAALAAGEPCPTTARELLDIGAVLAIREPGPTLARDADQLVAVRALEAKRKAAMEELNPRLFAPAYRGEDLE